jgi:hypothetical protein
MVACRSTSYAVYAIQLRSSDSFIKRCKTFANPLFLLGQRAPCASVVNHATRT